MPTPTPTTHLLYLHGFRSSPQSFKARMLGAHVAQINEHRTQDERITWWCPQLPPSPDEAVAQVLDGVASWPRASMAIVGSSLGGFYASVLGERLGCRVAVINPAVAPARDLARHIGEQTGFHNPDERFFFRPEFVAAFAALNPYPLTQPERCWALVAQGDEVLDWREMADHFQGATLTLLTGSDHAVSDFAQHLPALLDWLGLPRSADHGKIRG